MRSACILLALLAVGLAQGQLFEAIPFNIKGETLILDVASLDFNSNQSPASTPPLTKQSCAEACARVPGCNAWALCDSEAGCGSSCASYVEANPSFTALQPPNLGSGGPRPAWVNLPRITGFGPFGPTAGCQGNAWPYGLCTLKQLPDPSNPEFYSTNTKEGWVSGFTEISPQCEGTSASSCGRCLNSTNPAACLACAGSPAVNITIAEGALSNGTTRPEECAACFNATATPANSTDCVVCLTDPTACAASCPGGGASCGPVVELFETTVVITERTVSERNMTVTESGLRMQPGGASLLGLGRRRSLQQQH